MNRAQIIKEAKKVLKIEIDSTKTLNSSIGQSFYNVVKNIVSILKNLQNSILIDLLHSLSVNIISRI